MKLGLSDLLAFSLLLIGISLTIDAFSFNFPFNKYIKLVGGVGLIVVEIAYVIKKFKR